MASELFRRLVALQYRCRIKVKEMRGVTDGK